MIYECWCLEMAIFRCCIYISKCSFTLCLTLFPKKLFLYPLTDERWNEMKIVSPISKWIVNDPDHDKIENRIFWWLVAVCRMSEKLKKSVTNRGVCDVYVLILIFKLVMLTESINDRSTCISIHIQQDIHFRIVFFSRKWICWSIRGQDTPNPI